MTRVSLDPCVIPVSDGDRANAFYRDVLGAEAVPRGAGFAYRLGPVPLNAHGPGAQAAPLARLPAAPGNGARGAGVNLYFRAPDGPLIEFITSP